MAEVRKSRAFKALKQSMVEGLETRGLCEDIYRDKVEEYMEFWARRQELAADIRERGLSVMDERGRITENRSVSLEIQVSRQMLAIFTALGFKDKAAGGRPDGVFDDDEL